ncbi:MAG: ABC transporter permease [Candidatus Omnitrophota bacterium]|nr:MAG: ABC transporter permease [Candidatus Omnitrophota bacterium]
MKTEIFLALRYLFRGKAKHVSFIGVMSCMGVTLGVATVLVALSIVNGIDGGLMERIMKFRDHITIESLTPEKLPLVKETIERWEEVDFAAITLNTQVFAKFNNTIVPLIVKGIDFEDRSGRQLFYQYIKEERAEEGFFVGEGIERRFFVTDTIEFYPLKKKLQLEEEKVRGTFSVGLYDVDNYYLVTDLDKAKSLSSNYVLFLGVKLKEPFEADKAKEKIRQEFPEDIFVSTWIETNQALFATLKLEKIAMFIILSLIVIIASFNIFATLTVKVVEKTKEIGILKSLGFNNREVLSIFTLQGIIIGIIGIFAGSGLGLAICFILKTYPFIRLPQEIFFTEFLPVSVQLSDIVLIALVSLGISFVSSLAPAVRAARLEVCEALRYE